VNIGGWTAFLFYSQHGRFVWRRKIGNLGSGRECSVSWKGGLADERKVLALRWENDSVDEWRKIVKKKLLKAHKIKTKGGPV